jgi:DNA-binding NarL/FixJ family response regulator
VIRFIWQIKPAESSGFFSRRPGGVALSGGLPSAESIGQIMSLPNPSKTILFVYRNGSFHKFVAALLSGSGYRLITARNGADALHKACAFDGAIHLLLAGVELPGMTGMELAIQVHRERSDTKILLVSGLDSGILTLNKDWQFLPKPFMTTLLRDAIQDLLSDQEAPAEHAPQFAGMGQIVCAGARSERTILVAEGGGFRLLAALSPPTADWRLIAAGSGAEALQRAGEFAGTIHLLVANLDVADMTGVELAQRLSKERPDMEILLVSTMGSGTLILGNGWHFLPVPFETAMLRHKVLEILGDSGPLVPKHARATNVGVGPRRLTSREVQILKLIAAGNSTKQAAALLGIAFKTAAGHRSRLMKKLAVHDTTALVRYAIRAGFIDS